MIWVKTYFPWFITKTSQIPANPIQIVTDLKSLQIQANQDFQRTLINLNGTVLIPYF
jgi:hypothetical protein